MRGESADTETTLLNGMFCISACMVVFRLPSGMYRTRSSSSAEAVVSSPSWVPNSTPKYALSISSVIEAGSKTEESVSIAPVTGRSAMPSVRTYRAGGASPALCACRMSASASASVIASE